MRWEGRIPSCGSVVLGCVLFCFVLSPTFLVVRRGGAKALCAVMSSYEPYLVPFLVVRRILFHAVYGSCAAMYILV